MSTPAPDGSASGPDPGVLRTVAVIAVLVLVLVFYFLLLGRIAIGLLVSGDVAAVAIGVGVLILPLLGVWMVTATVRAALAHQHLARRIHAEGLELDVSPLPRRPSGRIDRAAADELFLTVKQEWEADPDNWRVSYRLARAYDYAGDRARARATMRRAVELEKREREGDRS
ncbi:hypothetical protein [Nocardia brevicatena]|uniref:hypothetical protein n=1 Tax=Nocardia brevicatena TaxID=37327 RepID=UPI00068425C0|nr:hypothetical protein [Nocardia brevicatena]